MTAFIHASAEVSPDAILGDDAMIWNWTKIREHAHIGANVNVGQNVYIDHGVSIGEGSKIQNGVNIYAGVTIGKDVFVGPSVTFTNDLYPRASGQWEITETVIEDGVSIGANSTIVCGVRLGAGCLIGAGTVVIRDVGPGELVVGNPARCVGHVDAAGNRVLDSSENRIERAS